MIRCVLILTGLLIAGSAFGAELKWDTVDEVSFSFRLPQGWKRVNVQGYDSHVGLFVCETASLEFDEVRQSVSELDSELVDYIRKESDRKLLKKGEEIWRLEHRIVLFTNGMADVETYGHRRFDNVATLRVPYAGKAVHLKVRVFYKSVSDYPTARRILQSFEWPLKMRPMDETPKEPSSLLNTDEALPWSGWGLPVPPVPYGQSKNRTNR